MQFAHVTTITTKPGQLRDFLRPEETEPLPLYRDVQEETMDASEDTSRTIASGTPIFAVGGEKLGRVSTDGVLGGYLIMQVGSFFHHDVSVPVSAIQQSTVHGVYLNRTREEIHNLTLGGWSSLGNVDLNTGMPANSVADRDDAPAAPTRAADAAPPASSPVPAAT
jgi:hypothetical protein